MTPTKLFRQTTLAFLFSCFAMSNHGLSAEVFKWVDEYGNTHYSDKKPDKQNHQSLKVYSGQTSAARNDIYEQVDTLEKTEQSLAEQKKEAEKTAKEKAQKDQQCKTIRENLKIISESARIKVDENGEKRYLSPDELNEKKASYQDMLKKYCI